ncbi:MAG: 2-hydroxychromene-2-carboxylate isomerase [Burkholderiales bacterium]
MKRIDFYFDFISPYAHLAFEQLPNALMGLSYSVTHKPVVFGAVLKARGQRGPAEIEGKRDWTYRHALWLAREHGIELQMSASHPFNPLALLRLAVACDQEGLPNRYVCQTIFRHVWRGGLEAADADRLAALQRELAPPRDPGDEAVKLQLRAHTEEGLARGLFGVPTFAVDDKLFWGFEALPMLRAYLENDDWFDGPGWAAAGERPVGVMR